MNCLLPGSGQSFDFFLFSVSAADDVIAIAISTRVARLHIFKPKNTIWVNFAGSCNGRCCYILCPFGLHIYGRLVDFGIFYGYLVYFPHFGMLYQNKSGNPD
jgi:hypothetical protein